VPTYQYACTACDERLEAVQSFTDAALTQCPACGGRLRKVFSAVGVVFKGSGFYKNDSRESATSSKAKDGEAGGSGDKAGAGDKARSGDKAAVKAESSGDGGASKAAPAPAASGATAAAGASSGSGGAPSTGKAPAGKAS